MMSIAMVQVQISRVAERSGFVAIRSIRHLTGIIIASPRFKLPVEVRLGHHGHDVRF